MNHVERSAGTLALLVACACPLHASATPSRAEAVVAASKRATGGAAWDALQGCAEEGTHGSGSVAYRTWFSLRHYGMRVESRRDGAIRMMGFDGHSGWRTSAAGTAEISDDPNARREAITTTYLSSNGFYFPDRFPASFRYLRQAVRDGLRFDVLEITPEGGRPLEYWFDRRSHLLLRVIDNQGPRPVVVEASDYRRAGAISVAFALTTRDADGAILDQGAVTSLRCGPVDEALFAAPRTL